MHCLGKETRSIWKTGVPWIIRYSFEQTVWGRRVQLLAVFKVYHTLEGRLIKEATHQFQETGALKNALFLSRKAPSFESCIDNLFKVPSPKISYCLLISLLAPELGDKENCNLFRSEKQETLRKTHPKNTILEIILGLASNAASLFGSSFYVFMHYKI